MKLQHSKSNKKEGTISFVVGKLLQINIKLDQYNVFYKRRNYDIISCSVSF